MARILEFRSLAMCIPANSLKQFALLRTIRRVRCVLMNTRGIAGVVLCALAAGCQPSSTTPAAPKPAAKPAGPSKVSGAVKESDLAKVELTEDAEKRLGVTPGGLVAVEK